MELTYENLLDEVLQELPEFKDAYNKELSEDSIDKDSDLHIVFSYVFVPLLSEAIKAKSELTTKMFNFLEKMASSHDHLVQEVCDFTVLEELCDEFKDSEIYSYFGESTKKGFFAVRQYIGDRNCDGSPKYS